MTSLSRFCGVTSMLGGVLAVLASVPGQWYGVPQTDSYVFDPTPWSPLWIERIVVPLALVVASAGLVLGIAGLVRRDYAVAGRWRRLGGLGAVLGTVGATGGVTAFVALSTGERATGAAFVGVLSLFVATVSGVVLVVSLLALAVGYARTTRPTLGYAFAGTAVGVSAVALLLSDPLRTVTAASAVGVTWGLVGRDLWRFADPLPAATESDETASCD